MIASSIMMGRALAPVEGARREVEGLPRARRVYDRLPKLLAGNGDPSPSACNAPRADRARSAPRTSDRCASRHAHAIAAERQLRTRSPAQVVGVIGPERGRQVDPGPRRWRACGRRSPGHLRLDGSDIDNWDSELSGATSATCRRTSSCSPARSPRTSPRFATIDADEVDRGRARRRMSTR